jgi:DNA-binding HxlR family transcriptional regulator
MSKLATDLGTAERAIILELLRDDHPAPWTRKEIKRAIYDIKGWVLDHALARLEADEVVTLAGKEVWLSLAVRHLEDLGMISI